MKNQVAVENYMEDVKERLESDGFNCHEDIAYQDYILRCMAKRTRFKLTKFGYSETFFCFAEISSPTVKNLRKFSSDCFNYAKEFRSIPLPCGLFESVWCFSVAIVNGIEMPASLALKNEAPPKHWAAAEIPVVYDLSSNSLCYFEKTPIWGAAYYSGFRKMITLYLTP
ncbi:MAG: hypothetical protein HZA48_02510 [Planctomycetes bacterium]|nr:hypothetical protein [Planctomycetota bacterium]